MLPVRQSTRECLFGNSNLYHSALWLQCKRLPVPPTLLCEDAHNVVGSQKLTRMLVFGALAYQIASSGVAALGRAASAFEAQRFSDHAPLIVRYDYNLRLSTGSLEFVWCFDMVADIGGQPLFESQ